MSVACVKFSAAFSQAWWCTSVISPFRGWRHEDQEFKIILDYIVSSRPD